MVLNAGRLRELVLIKKPERISNQSGGYSTEYVEVMRTFASVREVQPSADIIASQENVISLTEFIIRYRPDHNLEIGYRIEWRDFNFTLNRFKVDPARTVIIITANSEIEETKR